MPPPLPAATQQVFVNKGGNDATGNGTQGSPYLTLTKAMSTILDAAAAKQYSIQIGPGSYNDNVAMKSFVTLDGIDPSTVTLTGTLSLDAGFAANGFLGLVNVTVSLAQVIAWGAIAGAQLGLDHVSFASDLTVSGGGSASSITAIDTQFSGNLSVADANVVSLGCFVTGNVAYTSPNFAILWKSYGDAFAGNVTETETVPHAISMVLVASSVKGSLNLSGAAAGYQGTAGGIPPVVGLAGGAASPTALTAANGIAYTAAVVGNWNGNNPVSTAAALDRIAAKITPIP
jgi:hypothetical protein